MISIRPLTRDDLPAAIGLVGSALSEIPLYLSVLGDYADQQDARDWLCKILLRPRVGSGTASGAFDDDRLIGVLSWTIADRPPPPIDDDELTRDATFLAERRDLFDRLRTAHADEEKLLTHPDPAAVSIQIAAVAPDQRRSGAMLAMLASLAQFCYDEQRPCTCWTGSERLRRGFAGLHPVLENRTVMVGEVPMYYLVFDHRIPPGASPSQPTQLSEL